MSRAARSPLWAVLGCSVWIAVACNAALWRQMGSVGLFNTPGGWAFTLALALMVACALAAMLSLLAWRWTLKPAAALLAFGSSVACAFMLNYRVAIDSPMIESVLQTDLHEAADLISLPLVGTVLLLAVPPLLLLWRLPLRHGSALRQLARNAGTALAVAAVLGATAIGSFQPLASVTREHRDLRYLVTPLNVLAGVARAATQPWRQSQGPVVAIGQDARLAENPARTRPALLLLVLGETARSGNFGVNGYGRDTTPELARERIASLRHAWSCGTSTATSVPCMFSHLGRAAFERRSVQYEGLLDVVQRAGLAVLWLDNQSGCKGVCDRVPNVNTARSAKAGLCADGQCLDGMMLEGLDARIAALDPARRARGVVVVMHQMGSHGPQYHLRSPAAQKRFMPECTASALFDCSRESLVNAYDNSIAYTDHFLAAGIAWLKRQQGWADPAMVYVADHGESLGEANLFLHGLPYALAPEVQKRVPWITWLSPGFSLAKRLSIDCLRQHQDLPVSHDHYFHSVLGLLDLATSIYKPELDTYAACRADVR